MADSGTLFNEIIKAINNGKFTLKLDLEKREPLKLKENTKENRVKDIYDTNKELLDYLLNKREVLINIKSKEDNVVVDLSSEEQWIKYIEFVCNDIDTIKEYLNNKKERLSAAVKYYKESTNKLEMSLQHFGCFFLSLIKVFSNNINKDKKPSITINPYETYYKIKKDEVNKISNELSNFIFSDDNKNEVFINEFNDAWCEYVSHLYNKYVVKDRLCCINFNVNNKNKKIEDMKFPKNILLKGVPGTGKSRKITNLINPYINVELKKNEVDQVLRINVHSASSNSDLMQGIGVLTRDNNIIYKEKTGSVLNHIFNAIMYPNIPFFLILEEIQENSLNEIIGDLIYLIEEEKRVNLKLEDLKYLKEKMSIYKHIEYICKNNENINYVSMPYLVEENIKGNKKIIIPDNLYLLCTTNYRDDKKIIEDNLFRRFEVIDVFPDSAPIKNFVVKDFFNKLNDSIIKEIDEPIHKDRYLIGHSNWINVNTKNDFLKVFIKLVNEFKEIREVEFEDFKKIISSIKLEDEPKNEDDKKDKDSKMQNKGSNNLIEVKDIKGIINEVKQNNNNSYFELLKKIYSDIGYNDMEKLWK